MDECKRDPATGMPKDKSYLEKDLPEFLNKSLSDYKQSLAKLKNGINDYTIGDYWCCLYSDINVAEVSNIISPEAAYYLRTKYLGIKYGKL